MQLPLFWNINGQNITKSFTILYKLQIKKVKVLKMSKTLLRNILTIAIFLAISWAVMSIEQNDYDDHNPEMAGYFEGDIMPDFPTRNGFPNRKWPNNTIKYVFSSSFSKQHLQMVFHGPIFIYPLHFS